ncbi:MAG: hypothetical protein RJA13_1478 [Bacteroidota bacterium]|jgi:hypothetical protein
MKTICLAILAIICISTQSFSQETSVFAVAQSSKELKASKLSGTYTFVLPEGLSQEQVTKNALYYDVYFTVEYSEKTNTAKIKLIKNNETSRLVITRFLLVNGAQSVKVDGKMESMSVFFTKHLKD